MNFAGLLFLLMAHFFTGRGILRMFKLQLDPVPAVCFSFMIGVPVISFIPCVLQLMSIPINATNVLIAISVLTFLCSLPLLLSFTKPRLPKFVLPKFHELPFLLVILFFIVVSVWRCYYMPPYSRDMLSGPELIAEYTVREQTLINSVFTVDLSTSNNYHKSPFLTCLQVIYKLLVYPYGQLWLSVLFLSFITWIYTLLYNRVHPFLAGLLLLLFLGIPEMFAYSFVILYDYSNMVFFFLGFFFLIRYLQTYRINDFAFSVFIFGLATYIRTESIILIGGMVPLLVFNLYKRKVSVKAIVMRISALLAVALTFYMICINVFVRKFIPIPMNVADNINSNLGNVGYLFDRLSDMSTLLIFSEPGKAFYGYFIFIFLWILAIDIVWLRRFNKEAVFALYGIAVIYLGLGFIGYLLPLADLPNTTKRGLFKAMPMLLLYMANSGVILKLSEFIRNWELPKKIEAVPVKNQKQPSRKKP